jgi:Ca2+/Na+ antiporter
VRTCLAIFALIAAAFVLWGVGSAVRRLAKAPRGRWAVSIGIGLAAFVFAGGVLNLAHIAYRPVIWALVVAAAAVGVNEARRAKPQLANAIPASRAARLDLLLTALVIAAVMIFTIATQLPPRQFNYQDDLQKYFAHPVRMLETGTFAGSPLSALGSETLGGQAFLHGIVLSALPLPYINGVDAVFALFVMMLIAAGAGWRRFGPLPGAALGALLVALINPLYANVSGLYTAAVLIATAVMLVADEHEKPSPMLLGLVYAAMVAIKPSFGLFAAFHVAFSTVATGAGKKHWKAALPWPARVTAASAVCIAPWLLMYLPTYFSHGTFVAKSAFNSIDLSDVNPFSTKRIFNGDNALSYTVIAAAAALVMILAIIAWVQGRKIPEGQGENDLAVKPLGIFAGAAAGVACFLTLVLYFPLWTGFQVCVRYSVPFLLGACVTTVLLAPSLSGKLSRVSCVAIPAVACMAIVALFAPAAKARAEQAVRYGSILEFTQLSTLPDYTPYIQHALSDATRQQIVQLQSQVPPGAALFAWIDTPYFLDYRRNKIVDMDMAGTATAWAHVPAGTQYFLWQYQGHAVWKDGDFRTRMQEPRIGARDRLIAKRSYDVANLLSQLANHYQVVAQLHDGNDAYVLFRLPSSQP